MRTSIFDNLAVPDERLPRSISMSRVMPPGGKEGTMASTKEGRAPPQNLQHQCPVLLRCR
jgi:hypothetical protein